MIERIPIVEELLDKACPECGSPQLHYRLLDMEMVYRCDECRHSWRDHWYDVRVHRYASRKAGPLICMDDFIRDVDLLNWWWSMKLHKMANGEEIVEDLCSIKTVWFLHLHCDEGFPGEVGMKEAEKFPDDFITQSM